MKGGRNKWQTCLKSSVRLSRSLSETLEEMSRSASVIVIATILAPTIADYTGTGGALADYAGLLGAVIVMVIVGVLMVAVKLISSKM